MDDLVASLPHEDDKRRPNVDSRHYELAERMKRFLLKRYGPLASRRDAVWHEALAIFERTGTDWQQIVETWTWYETHAERFTEGPDRLPDVRHARQFRQHYDWVRRVMARHQTRQIPASALPLEALPAYQRLARLNWPPTCREQLVAVFARSLKEVRSLTHELTSTKLPRRLTTACDTLLADIGDPVVFVERWLTDLYERIRAFDGYGDDLTQYAFDRRHPRFTRRPFVGELLLALQAGDDSRGVSADERRSNFRLVVSSVPPLVVRCCPPAPRRSSHLNTWDDD